MSEGEEVVPSGTFVPVTPVELLTSAFYAWELRGRGWKVWDDEVTLEPPFTPFILPEILPSPQIDDGRKPTFLSTLVGWFQGLFLGPPDHSSSPVWTVEEEEDSPRSSEPSHALIELQVSLPSLLKVTRESAEQLLLSLTYVRSPISFELIGSENKVTIQFVCREPDASLVSRQLKAYFSDISVEPARDFLGDRVRNGEEPVIIEFGLSEEFIRPLRVCRNFDVDPLIAAIGALSDIRSDELGVMQVLFQPARHPWSQSIIRSAMDAQGNSFFCDAPEMVGLAREKVEQPLFAAIIRIAARSDTESRAMEMIRSLGGAFVQVGRHDSNELIPLNNDDYPAFAHQEDLVFRTTHRSGMILNARELVSLVHLPSDSVRSQNLARQVKRTKVAPPSVVAGVALGENICPGRRMVVRLSTEQRLRHMHVIGATGTGKSTFLKSMIIQDIENGEGVGVIDPHGDLIEEILGYIPEKRFQDVVLFDPGDSEYPIGFNVLTAHTEIEKNILSSDLVAVFRRFSTSWGDQMTSVLGNAILAFLESTSGGTLLELRQFLVDAPFRKSFLKTVGDDHIVYYWEKEFPLLSGRPQASVLTRLDTFLRPKLIRNIVTQREKSLNFHKILNEQNIFLAKLAQGVIGEENAYTMGAFLISKINQVVMGRQDMSVVHRKPFYLTIDEFQNFITPSLTSLLAGARKYRLGLIMAHQDMEQLSCRDTQVASSVISNPYTRIAFRLGHIDAKKLEHGYSFFKAEDLQNLGVGEAIGRVERSDQDFNLTISPPPMVASEVAESRRTAIVKYSRTWYATEKSAAQQGHLSPIATPHVESERPIKPMQKERVSASVCRQDDIVEREKQLSSGRGGAVHKYLQTVVKKLAEDRGYRAVVEQQILGGQGRVDVSLEREGRKLACEISVTSTTEYELGNIKKCLASGYERVVLLSSEKRFIDRVKSLIATNLEKDIQDKVTLLNSEEFPAFLNEFEAKSNSVKEVVRGYRVKVNYRPLAQNEQKIRRRAVGQVLAKSMGRLKDSK